MITFTSEDKLTPVDAWSIYTACNLHFNPERDYDAIKYNFKGPRCDPAKFNAHKQKFLFEKLVRKYPKRNDYIGYCIANELAGKKWINEFSDEAYNIWLGKIQALDYNFTQDISRWAEEAQAAGLGFDECILPADRTDLPFIYKLYKEEKIAIETLAIVENLARYISALNEKLNDPMKVASTISHKISRYAPFLAGSIDIKKYTTAITKQFTN